MRERYLFAARIIELTNEHRLNSYDFLTLLNRIDDLISHAMHDGLQKMSDYEEVHAHAHAMGLSIDLTRYVVIIRLITTNDIIWTQ